MDWLQDNTGITFDNGVFSIDTNAGGKKCTSCSGGGDGSSGDDNSLMMQLQMLGAGALDAIDPRGRGYVDGGLRVAGVVVGLYVTYRVVRAVL